MAEAAVPPAFAEHGLSAGEVAERRERGAVNVTDRRTSRSVGEIVRSNIFTRFNAIIAVLAAVVLVVGHPIDALFAFVMVVNSAIGIVQEVRAKRTLDRLTVLIAPTVVVVRDGDEQEIAPTELVIDDLIRLRSGDEVPVYFSQRATPHQIGLSDVLATLALAEEQPRDIVILGMVPSSLELTLELSHEIDDRLDALVEACCAELNALGYAPSPAEG